MRSSTCCRLWAGACWRSAAESDADDARFVVRETYLQPAPFSAAVQRAGLTMTFDGMRHPLGELRALEAAGLLIEAIREPAAPQGARDEQRWARLPMFLLLRAVKPRPPSSTPLVAPDRATNRTPRRQ